MKGHSSILKGVWTLAVALSTWVRSSLESLPAGGAGKQLYCVCPFRGQGEDPAVVGGEAQLVLCARPGLLVLGGGAVSALAAFLGWEPAAGAGGPGPDSGNSGDTARSCGG